MSEQIKGEEIRIEKLSVSHTELIRSFKSYESELVDFLIEDALDNQDKKVSVTYLWFLRSSNELIGYVTLLTDKISLSNILKEEFQGKGIPYKSLPALKIGRICTENNFLRRGVGRLMIEFVIYKIREISEKCGCRFITLDAKRNSDRTKDSLHFYRKLGFEVLKDREKGTTAMYKDVFKIIEPKN